MLEDQGKDRALDDPPSQRHIAGDLGDLAPAGLPLVLLEVLQLGQRCREQLENDRSINERKDAQGEHAHGGEAAPGEDVEESQELTTLLDESLESDPVDSRHRHIDAEAHDQEQPEGDQHPVAQPLGLNQLAEDFSGARIAPPTDDHMGWVRRGEKKRSQAQKAVRQAQGHSRTAPTLTGKRHRLSRESRRCHRRLRSWREHLR